MRSLSLMRAVALTLCAGVLSSCASTRILSHWTDPSITSKIRKALVIGVGPNATNRRLFEDTFSGQLNSKGATALTSYQFIPEASQVSRETVAPLVGENQITHVIVARLVDRKTVETYVPPTVSTSYYPSYPTYYGGWYDYYHTSYSTTVSPGYTYETTYVNVETNVYDVSSEKLIWSGLTETELGSNITSQLGEYVAILLDQLQKDKLL